MYNSHISFHPFPYRLESSGWGASLDHEAESSTWRLEGATGQKCPSLRHHEELYSLGPAPGRLLPEEKELYLFQFIILDFWYVQLNPCLYENISLPKYHLCKRKVQQEEPVTRKQETWASYPSFVINLLHDLEQVTLPFWNFDPSLRGKSGRMRENNAHSSLSHLWVLVMIENYLLHNYKV